MRKVEISGAHNLVRGEDYVVMSWSTSCMVQCEIDIELKKLSYSLLISSATVVLSMLLRSMSGLLLNLDAVVYGLEK
ncbi:hypothetical protein ACN38_g7849 [Penicillium nordicum]|uniref:Uncharacterized protein n=1 Tax=Penicillium nordicum TaxID=229535 RepID=A0A0M8P6B2_9EURO|nr:hypothetical protein ACN38_g7849 [Penicillium nordicum]